ncbi:hypothetical protein GQ44DRAFT_606302 [Phaeosphaeriaceae sp. PMI808]|nr:hypothetical protein GQ44DRAFT_606302 [Phaeosphaeriaceae sp. PMI808]
MSSGRIDDAPAERWAIPRLNMHMMSQHTGPDDHKWPQSLYFNSTINFDIVLPNHTHGSESSNTTSNCEASFPNGTLPDASVPLKCTSPSDHEQLMFTMSVYKDLGPRRKELSFILSMTSVVEYDQTKITYQGNTPITANNPQEPTSYLTCLEERPLDGLRCSIQSSLSVDKELVIDIMGFGVGGFKHGTS